MGFRSVFEGVIYVKWMIFQIPPNQISLCRTVEKERNLEWKSQLETLDEGKLTRSNTSECRIISLTNFNAQFFIH